MALEQVIVCIICSKLKIENLSYLKLTSDYY